MSEEVPVDQEAFFRSLQQAAHEYWDETNRVRLEKRSIARKRLRSQLIAHTRRGGRIICVQNEPRTAENPDPYNWTFESLKTFLGPRFQIEGIKGTFSVCWDPLEEVDKEENKKIKTSE